MMATAESADSAHVNYLEEANLKPPKHATSSVWKYFGFRHEDGIIKDHSHVSYCHPASNHLLIMHK